jgi:CheY-like chemotaxis protein
VLASFYLEQAGLDVTLVENGKLACDAALAAVRNGTPFDMILMDMQMPEMDGYAATEFLRSQQYTGPIIAFTAHAMGGDREKCLACGCTDFAVKPIDPPAFNATIRKYAREAGHAPEPAPAEVIAAPETASTPMHPDDPVKALLAKPKLAKLVEKFVTGLDDRLAAIKKAVEEEDHKQLKILSHQLKGAAGGFGFPNISRVAADMEHVDEKQIATLSKAVRELAELCDQAKQVAVRPTS